MNTLEIKNYIYTYIEQFLNNDNDEIGKKYNKSFIIIKNNNKVMTILALKLKNILIENKLNINNFLDLPNINYYIYELLKEVASNDYLQ